MGKLISLGLIETRGFAGLTEATDAMNKAADVDFVQQFYIGGSFAIVMVKGEVAATRASIAAGRARLEELCAVVAVHNIASIDEDVVEAVVSKKAPPDEVPRGVAMGVIETQGVAGAFEAAKQGLDAADVSLLGFLGPGGGLMATCFQGAVADVRAAVTEAERHCAEFTKVYGTTVLPAPHPALLKGFGPNYGEDFSRDATALGTLETMGFVALLEASDAALKAGDVAPGHWMTIGSGYNSVSYRGEVAAVRAAMEAAEAVARTLDRYVDSVIIPSPHEATEALL